jgi:hypothetical protein
VSTDRTIGYRWGGPNRQRIEIIANATPLEDVVVTKQAKVYEINNASPLEGVVVRAKFAI